MSNKQQKKRQYLRKNKESFDAELWAISDTLELSIKKTRNKSSTTITIFTDLYAVIAKILESKVRPGKNAIRDLIYQNALNIRNNGYTLVLQWISSYSKILGKEKTNIVAKDIAYKKGRRTNYWSLLTHIKTELQNTRAGKLLRQYQAKSQERKATM